MIATNPNTTTFELKTANGFPPLFQKNSVTSDALKTTKFIDISFAEFDYKFNFEVTKQSRKTKTQIFHAKINGELLTLTIKQDSSQNKLAITPQKDSPTAVFLVSTLMLMMGLSKNTRIKSSYFDFTVLPNFEMKQLTQFLQQRDLAYKLMVVSNTFNQSFIIPNSVELSEINYCYKSIIDRKFEWECKTNEEVGFTETGNEQREILGKIIDLGEQKFTFLRYKIAEVKSITTPTLPKNAFNKDIQKLIDLEEKFTSTIMDRYLNSFSNVFEGLTEVQITTLTERPSLDEEAFDF